MSILNQLFHFLTAKSDEKLNNVPERDKGEADKETKGAAKVRDKGVKGVDEVLSQNDGAQRPVGDDHAKGVQVPEISGDHFVLIICAWEETPSSSLKIVLVHHCYF